MNKMKDPDFLRGIVKQDIDGIYLPVTDIFIAESQDSDHAIAKLNSDRDFSLITDITKPRDSHHTYCVNTPWLYLNVEHGSDAKLDVNDYNMQFNGYITNNQIDLLLNSKVNLFGFARLNSIVYRSDTNKNMVWLENNDNEFLFIHYIDEIGKRYWEMVKFNNTTFNDSYNSVKVSDD